MRTYRTETRGVLQTKGRIAIRQHVIEYKANKTRRAKSDVMRDTFRDNSLYTLSRKKGSESKRVSRRGEADFVDDQSRAALPSMPPDDKML